jgi:uncharacterized protein (TIGR02453 family)
MFTPATFKFLRELKTHNEREWFNTNKTRYERDVRDPMIEFIREMAPRLAKISKHIVADARPVGGSMFRIYRDTRFSSDKTPYKTHAAAHFRHHTSAKDVHGPGLYFHLEPKGCFIAGGLWRPEPGAVLKIRTFIAENPAAWKKAVKGLELGGESLKRPPAGFDVEHPLIEDLKRKDFIASVELDDKDVCSANFAATASKACERLAPLMKSLAKATEIPW